MNCTSARCGFTISIGATSICRRSCSCMAARSTPTPGTSSAWRCATTTTASRSTSAATATATGRHDADYTMGAQLADTKGFVDHLGLDKFILVGMSLGAINSLAFAINHPERLNNLVIIDAGPEMRRPGSSRIRDFVNGVADTVTIEAIIEKALEFNPRRDPKILRRSLMHALAAAARRHLEVEIRPPPLSGARPGDAPRRARRARRRPLPHHLPDPDRARRRKRRVPRGRRHPPGRSACPTASSSPSPAPATRCRATTRKTSSPSCGGSSEGRISPFRQSSPCHSGAAEGRTRNP